MTTANETDNPRPTPYKRPRPRHQPVKAAPAPKTLRVKAPVVEEPEKAAETPTSEMPEFTFYGHIFRPVDATAFENPIGYQLAYEAVMAQGAELEDLKTSAMKPAEVTS